mmetsp:Transcript_27150/g.20316  ORF Transcript_27150/g.20316 Transcript_27150/m.20316 type:complete len:292 (+) Transcript_27150:59-934(+)|eukprot:CAMPEP_0202972066 /NCGR_PEP_ID=MMETSP1396-20130829/33045_1 /ASSEMBLY_ACC=CAM_ASM_000872 /TAXON_ID= /ORGANISM="Pseudokeronopsis sp., Strain Brazil" /LENGTH=291 /DNA_ID=CAMNT_0049702087 /DNA_START=22 /DNA_END=897 /DNA_ORIENTATION=-
MPYLTKDQVEFFNENGYLLIENFWDEETVNTLMSRMIDIVTHANLDNVKTVFSTKEQARRSDEYFLTSGREIRFFWEEKAWNADESLVDHPVKCINKVGHGLHDLDPDFQRVSYEPRIGSMCRELGQEHPLCVQSMYIFKQPKIGGEVCAHQDGTFLYTDPQTCIGFWWPLHDCTQENGCLWAVPGSHKLGVHRRFRRVSGEVLETEFVPKEPVVWDLTNAVPLETRAGTLVVLHAALVHYSAENTSDFPRHAYSIHIVDGRDGVSYPSDNWLQRPENFPFNEITSTVDNS